MPVASPRLSFVRGTLVLEGIRPAVLKQTFPAGPWTWDGRTGAWRCDALEYLGVRRAIRDHDCEAVDLVPHWSRITWPSMCLPNLRPEQNDALAAWKATGRGILVMPTGTGKTEVALTIMHRAAVATLIVAPVRDLMYQWQRRILRSLGYDAGVVGMDSSRCSP